jgi:hypothetical protein
MSNCLSFWTVLFAFLSTFPQECWITLLKSVEEIKSTMRKKIGQQKIAAAVQRGLDTSADLTLPMRESSAHHRYTKNVQCSPDPQLLSFLNTPPISVMSHLSPCLFLPVRRDQSLPPFLAHACSLPPNLHQNYLCTTVCTFRHLTSIPKP